MNLFLLVCDVFLFVFWKNLKTPKMHFETIWPLENISWNLTAIRHDFKKALSQLYLCYRCPMGGLKLACWPRYWLCACSISLMEQTLLWRLWPSHMMSLVKTDGQMEAVSTSLNAFLLLKKRHFGFRVSRCWIQNQFVWQKQRILLWNYKKYTSAFFMWNNSQTLICKNWTKGNKIYAFHHYQPYIKYLP